MFNIAIFASGTGSNAEKIIEYFDGRKDVNVKCIVTNKETAGVLKIAERYGMDSGVFKRTDFEDPAVKLLNFLDDKEIDLIVLAGFLLKIPDTIVDRYEGRIINIHPALLPHFGGKGMYGDHVHKAVLESGRKVSGITIHFVDRVYDNGEILLQEEIEIADGETVESLRKKIRKLEHYHYPRTIDKLLKLADV